MIIFILGWGRIRGGGPLGIYLQEAPMNIASHQHCQSLNGPALRVDNATMICAGAQGKGACHGDSGGPLSCNENGTWVVRGVASWVIGNCRTDRYTVFARVSGLRNWINNITSRGKLTPVTSSFP
jgi:secreted trypsin-like serine protease